MAYHNILIGMPTMGGSMKTGTMLSIVDTMRALQQRGIESNIHNVDSAEIVTARDMLANMVLHGDWDALLFIDSDMSFRPDLVLKLIESGAEVAAAACPRRQLDLGRFSAGVSEHGNVQKALAQASDFTVNFNWSGKPMEVTYENGFAKAAAVGMAVALIGKSALQAMVKGKVVDRRRDLSSGNGNPCYSFFEILSPPISGRLGEDYSFCYRWTAKLKRELLVCVDEEVSHIGFYQYRARFSDLAT